jgi:hypothetical protein
MFKLSADERLTHWRDFRKQLDEQSMSQALLTVVEFWRSCPFSPYYLDPDNPKQWPDPWTLVEENWYCDLAKAIGMLYTIKFTKHDPDVSIRVYQDPVTGYSYNLVWIDQGKYILNLVQDEIVNKEYIETEWKLKFEYKDAELKLDNY